MNRTRIHKLLGHLASRLRGLPGGLHRDERGVVSLLTVFVALIFTVIAGMIMNVAQHVDDRMRMQNAADAATYSGGVVMARSTNTLAFSNHLLCEAFALTAYLDVVGQTDFRPLTNQLLTDWTEAGRVMEQTAGATGVPKFQQLGRAIQDKIEYEVALVDTYHDVAQRHAESALPAFRSMLGSSGSVQGGPIVRFQRDLVRGAPALAQLAAFDIAGRYDDTDRGFNTRAASHNGQPLRAALWRAHGTAAIPIVGNEEDPLLRTLPAVDPSPFGPDKPDEGIPNSTDYYIRTARAQRRDLSFFYLEQWTAFWMGPYFSYAGIDGADVAGSDTGIRFSLPGRMTAKMSDLIDLVRSATRSRLDEMLEDEYRYTNLPHVYRRDWTNTTTNEQLDRDHTYVGVAYWRHIDEMLPGAFQNPLDEDGVDSLTFAQTTIFLPRPRFRTGSSVSGNRWRFIRRTYVDRDGVRHIVWDNREDNWPNGIGPGMNPTGNPVAQLVDPPAIPVNWNTYTDVNDRPPFEDVSRLVRDDRLLVQNWMVRLVPATSRAIPRILSTPPDVDPAFRSPRLQNYSPEELQRVSFH